MTAYDSYARTAIDYLSDFWTRQRISNWWHFLQDRSVGFVIDLCVPMWIRCCTMVTQLTGCARRQIYSGNRDWKTFLYLFMARVAIVTVDSASFFDVIAPRVTLGGKYGQL